MSLRFRIPFEIIIFKHDLALLVALHIKSLKPKNKEDHISQKTSFQKKPIAKKSAKRKFDSVGFWTTVLVLSTYMEILFCREYHTET